MEGHSIGFRTLPNIFNPDLSLGLTFLMAVIRDFLCNLLSRPLRILLLSDIEQISLRKPLMNLQVFLSLWQETCRFS
ncbi:hypothetical protein CS544_02775 [Porphyromonas gingivalis]|nr:hypothetical protein CS544_02775 [Porphyromonas gingivalis]